MSIDLEEYIDCKKFRNIFIKKNRDIKKYFSQYLFPFIKENKDYRIVHSINKFKVSRVFIHNYLVFDNEGSFICEIEFRKDY